MDNNTEQQKNTLSINKIRKYLDGSPAAKLIGIGLLALAFLLPTTMIGGVVSERTKYQQSAEKNIAESWAKAQEIAGPVLSVPYEQSWVDGNGSTKKRHGHVRLLPSDLKVKIELKPESRYRGIFEIPVYNSIVKITGRFDTKSFGGAAQGLKLKRQAAKMLLGLTDTRGVRSGIQLKWKSTDQAFGVSQNKLSGFGPMLAANAPISANDSGTFSIHIELAGSGSMHVLPLGDRSEIEIASSWKNPKFSGDFLPTERIISDDGFEAKWRVNQISRGLPSSWLDDLPKNDQGVGHSGFQTGEQALNNLSATGANRIGVELMNPTGGYQRITRALKYALLFVALSFGTLFVFELFGGLRVHPIQYLFVGSAQTLFHLMLLALSEHTGFGSAYTVATLSCVGLIVYYSAAILRARRRSLALTGVLGTLYGFVYVTLAAENFALLMGATALFGLLAAAMIASRKIDWYASEKRVA